MKLAPVANKSSWKEVSKMKTKTAWYLGAVLLLGLTALSVSCSLIEPPVPAPPVATIVPPVIPHSLEGRADCRLCHEAGIGGAPQFPADHNRRPSDVCLACHQTAAMKNGGSAPTTTPTPPVETTPTPPIEKTPVAVSAGELYATKCAACHGANQQGIPGFAPALTPESLDALSDIKIKDAILDGTSGTAMPAFKGTLSPEEIDALLQFIRYTAP